MNTAHMLKQIIFTKSFCFPPLIEVLTGKSKAPPGGFGIDWYISSNCDRKGQSYPVEYYLESVEKYSEGQIHNSEP